MEVPQKNLKIELSYYLAIRLLGRYCEKTALKRHMHLDVHAAAAKSLQSCLTLRPHRRQPTRLPRPWGSPGKNAGVGRHFLLQCMNVKTESEVTQSCPTLSDPMECSQPGSSVHGIFQARVLERGAIAFSTLMFIAALFTIGKTWEHTFRFLIHFELIFVNGMSKGPRVFL